MRVRTPRDIGAVIRTNRRSQDLSQSELASRAGVGREWLIAVEKGKANAGIARLLRVLAVLRVELDIRAPSEPPAGEKAAAQIDLASHIGRFARKRGR